MSIYQHDTIVPNETSNLSKKEQVAAMFNDIAFKYDFLNRFLSLGIDIYWRKKAIKEISTIKPKLILDVATGTADVALLIFKQLKPEKIIGIDISEGMLDLGRNKIKIAGLEKKILLQTGDSEHIHFDDNSFDAITVAFGVRNFQNLENGLKEMYRVLRPGGKISILEFSKPKQSLFKALYTFYMRKVTPGFGQLFSNNKAAYQYLNNSVEAFPEGASFLKILEGAGFKGAYLKVLSFGICTIYCGNK